MYRRDLGRAKRSRRDYGYFLLVVAELHSSVPADGHHDDPFVVATPPKLRLRLVRAMPKSNTAAWRLVFDELGYEPDFLVADVCTGIAAAVADQFDRSRTKFIPSLWHLTQTIKKALVDIPPASTSTPAGKKLVGPVGDHVANLSRASGVLNGVTAWSAWRDELINLVVSNQMPVDAMLRRRSNYEIAMANAIPALGGHPHVPARISARPARRPGTMPQGSPQERSRHQRQPSHRPSPQRNHPTPHTRPTVGSDVTRRCVSRPPRLGAGRR